MPYMSQSPSTTELDDIVRISPPAKYVALASTDSETKVKLEPVDGLRDSLDQKPELTFDVGKQVKQQVEEVDVQKMVEQTVKRVREQSDRWVCPLPPWSAVSTVPFCIISLSFCSHALFLPPLHL